MDSNKVLAKLVKTSRLRWWLMNNIVHIRLHWPYIPTYLQLYILKTSVTPDQTYHSGFTLRTLTWPCEPIHGYGYHISRISNTSANFIDESRPRLTRCSWPRTTRAARFTSRDGRHGWVLHVWWWGHLFTRYEYVYIVLWVGIHGCRNCIYDSKIYDSVVDSLMKLAQFWYFGHISKSLVAKSTTAMNPNPVPHFCRIRYPMASARRRTRGGRSEKGQSLHFPRPLRKSRLRT